MCKYLNQSTQTFTFMLITLVKLQTEKTRLYVMMFPTNTWPEWAKSRRCVHKLYTNLRFKRSRFIAGACFDIFTLERFLVCQSRLQLSRYNMLDSIMVNSSITSCLISYRLQKRGLLDKKKTNTNIFTIFSCIGIIERTFSTVKNIVVINVAHTQNTMDHNGDRVLTRASPM